MSLFLKSRFVSHPIQNGFRRTVIQCQRITLKFCKSHGSSIGVRNFIETEMVDFARRNPGIVMYLKPRRHRSPVVVAEYLNGERTWLSLHNHGMEEVAKWLETLRTSASEANVRYKSFHHTENPSIQGVWTPFSNKSPEYNVMEFPNDRFRDPENVMPSATEVALQRYGDLTRLEGKK